MKKINSQKKKIIMAMSGGIDSSVAAALLKRAGPAPEQARYGVNFGVIGVFMKFWSEHQKKGGNRCCSPEAEKRARTVAKILKIPFYVFNFEKEFKKKIVDYFLNEYKKGTTPNPCVVCNKEIKFGLLLNKALSLDADYVATGHYTQIKKEKDRIRLIRGKDKEKDQSYFLWQLNQKQLKHILFPVGDYTKTQVRALAKKFKLPVADIPESQEICFVQTTVNDFLKKYLKEKPGKIVDKKGKILGFHQGLYFYTIGQRKGLGFSGGPYFVLDRDIKKNLLIVTKNEKDLLKKELIAKNINWISGKVPKLPLKIKAKIRYRQEFVSAIIKEYTRGRARIVFLKPERAITPGQSVVFYNAEGDISGRARYKNQEVIGGGIIE